MISISTISKVNTKTLCVVHRYFPGIQGFTPQNPVLLGIAMGSLQGQVRVYHRCLKSVAWPRNLCR